VGSPPLASPSCCAAAAATGPPRALRRAIKRLVRTGPDRTPPELTTAVLAEPKVRIELTAYALQGARQSPSGLVVAPTVFLISSESRNAASYSRLDKDSPDAFRIPDRCGRLPTIWVRVR